MYSDSQYAYTVQDGYQVLDLPYQGGKTSMVVLLPQNTTALAEVSGSTLEPGQRLAEHRSRQAASDRPPAEVPDDGLQFPGRSSRGDGHAAGL